MAVIMVQETFDPPLQPGDDSPVADKVSPCLPVYDVTWLSSYIASDGTRCVCVYEADSAETVRQVYRTAGVQFDDVWAADPLHRSKD